MDYTDLMGSAAVVSVDGRRARSVKTREAIVDAFFALLDAGDLKPTAAAVAARAGLSVRSVFQHFADLEDLLLAVSDRQANRIASLYTGVQYDGDLAARIATFADYRARLFETIAPLRRAAMLQEPFSNIVAERLELARMLHRLDVERAFGPELEAARARGNDRLGDMVATVSSFVVWDEMRRHGGLDVGAATESLRFTVASLLSSGAA
jgi:TetR/AcrR family transcriptional regulator, regulator of autoinduction and epiphytic fitness